MEISGKQEGIEFLEGTEFINVNKKTKQLRWVGDLYRVQKGWGHKAVLITINT